MSLNLLCGTQAAFKRPLLSGGSSPRNSLEGRGALDWDGVKAEDKTLVHQVCLLCQAAVLPMPLLDPPMRGTFATHDASPLTLCFLSACLFLMLKIRHWYNTLAGSVKQLHVSMCRRHVMTSCTTT